MPADLTREEIDDYGISLVAGLLSGVQAERLLAYIKNEPTRIEAARQEGYREGVEAGGQWCRVRAYCAAIREREATDEQSRRAALLVKQTLDHAADVLPALSPPPAEPSAPAAPDWPTRCAALEADGIAARKRVVALEAENAKLREGLKDTTAHLVAAHSLLSRTPRAKKAAPSNTMFDMMLRDYETSCERARALLQGGPDATV